MDTDKEWDPAVELDAEDVESRLRDCLAWARGQAALHRTDDPVAGRAASLVATHIEEALYRLKQPVP